MEAAYQLKVAISKIINVIYFDYKKYHPFVITLRQCKKLSNLRYEDSKLYEYYKKFNPQNLSQVMFETDEIESLKHIDKYNICLPWRSKIIKIKGEKGLSINHGCQYFGKVSRDKGLLEFNRIIKLYNLIKKNGYNKKKKIVGYLLKNDNDYRVIVISGNHRMAVLAAMGNRYIRIKIRNKIPIELSFIEKWPLVEKNIITKIEAEKIFNRYFQSNGKNKFERINTMNNKKIYQPGAAIQKWNIISKYIDNNDKTLLDVGCNYGYIVNEASKIAIYANGIEANEKYIDQLNDKIKNMTVTPKNIKYIPKYDVITLLSVSHQWNANYGENKEKEMIRILGNKAIRKFFYQPASIKSKFGTPPNIIDNNSISIQTYYIKFLKDLFQKSKISYIGKTSLTTKKEPYRYMFLVEKIGD